MSDVQLPRDQRARSRLTRRQLVAGTAVTASGATAFGLPTFGSAQTPVASPVATAIDPAKLLDLSTRLAGGLSLPENAVEPLAALLGEVAGVDAALGELNAVAEFTPEALAATSAEAQAVAANILQYWFLGRFNSEPVSNRADLFFSLASWQTLPYATQQSLCKSFGYWAQEIEL